MVKVEGLHHLAICTGDMKTQIEYFTDKLGMELQALYWMHGVENTINTFLCLNDESSIAFVHNPDIAKIEPALGVSHAGNAGSNCLANITLELPSSNEPIDTQLWVDAEVVGLLGITEEELARFRKPQEYEDESGGVSQPGVDAPGPHIRYPEAVYGAMLAAPDEGLLYSVDNTPPVKIQGEAR